MISPDTAKDFYIGPTGAPFICPLGHPANNPSQFVQSHKTDLKSINVCSDMHACRIQICMIWGNFEDQPMNEKAHSRKRQREILDN